MSYKNYVFDALIVLKHIRTSGEGSTDKLIYNGEDYHFMKTDSDNLLHGIHPVDPNKVQTATMDVVFIHGLNGHAVATWSNTEENFWLRWLSEDFSKIAVWSVGYDATPSAWIKDTMPMEDRAMNILNNLAHTPPIGQRPILFIVHSMGGLLLKYMLEKAKIDDDYKHILKQTKGAVFLAVPHEGAGGASFLKALSIVFRVNDIVKQLEKNASALDRLDGSFNTIVKQKELKCISFFETKEIRIKKFYGLFGTKGIQIVSKASAKGRFIQPEPIGIDEDHIGICKLKSRDDLVYKNIYPYIQGILTDLDKSKRYSDIENSLSEPDKCEVPSPINQIFLIFSEDDLSEVKYEVIGYIQAEDEFESEIIEFAFEDINNTEEQEIFLEKLMKESELDNVPIHFILPSSLLLMNFKQWKYKGNEFVKLHHIILHNKEMFSRKISKYKPMIEKWNSLFNTLKDTNIADALMSVNNDTERFDTRTDKIGVCFEYLQSSYDVINETLIGAYMGLWQYPEGLLSDYQTWIQGDICLNQLNHESRKCDNVALLWDDMSLLENLKRRV